MYKFGEKIITLKKKAVDKLMEWNMFPFNQNVELDRRIIRALVYSCVKDADYENTEEEELLVMFVKGVLHFEFFLFYSFKKIVSSFHFSPSF